MKKINTNLGLGDLQSLGTVEDMGDHLISGSGKIYGAMTFGAPSDALSAGYFGIEKSKFEMTYPFNEQAIVIKGKVKFTNKDTNENFTFSEGDSWFVEKGTTVLWDVESEIFIKHYFAGS